MTETEDGTPGSGSRRSSCCDCRGERGRSGARVLLDEVGTNGSRKFRILAGSPARDREMPSFSKHFSATTKVRELMKKTDVLRPSTRWPGWLELAQDVDCGSPSFAAGVLVGAPRNGWVDWKTEAGRRSRTSWRGLVGPRQAWLVRGSNVSGADLVQKLWLPEERVFSPPLACARDRPGDEQGAPARGRRGGLGRYGHVQPEAGTRRGAARVPIPDEARRHRVHTLGWTVLRR
ncbi:DUF4357 domain-containing protein [Streptomyces sp. M10(2022)]